jgi:hypothetical protein
MLSAEGEAGYRRLVEQINLPRLSAMGFDPRAGVYAAEDPEKSDQRRQVVANLALTAKDPALRQKLGTAARAYLAGEKGALDPAWFDIGFAVVIDEGGLAAAKDLADKALASQDPLFRPDALGAVAGSGRADVAKWVLDEFTDARLRKSERLGMIRSVIFTRESRELGFEWLKANFDQLTSGGGGIFSSARLPGIVAGFCSVQRSEEIAALLRSKLKGKTGALELERTVERVRSCGILKEARGAELSAELAKIR